MTVAENQLLGLVRLSRAETAGQTTLNINPATAIKIRRGGVRDGLGIRTDVGLATFLLKNAHDPMDGGDIAPGQLVTVQSGPVPLPQETVYAQDFQGMTLGQLTSAGWSVAADVSAVTTTYGTPSSARLRLYNLPAEAVDVVSLTLTGLQVGRLHEIGYYVSGRSYGTPVGLKLPGQPVETPTDTSSNGTFDMRSAQWTATAETQTITWHKAASVRPPNGEFLLDDVQVSAAPFIGTRAIFTGRVAHLRSVYPMDKATGATTAMTEVTVADAVLVHGQTMRYGVDLGPSGFETFEARINRLSASANAPVEPLVVGAPKEVYGF